MRFLISPIKADGGTGSGPGALPLLEIGGIDENDGLSEDVFSTGGKSRRCHGYPSKGAAP